MPFFAAQGTLPINPGHQGSGTRRRPVLHQGVDAEPARHPRAEPLHRGPVRGNVNRIEIDIGLPLETIKLNIDRGVVDMGDLPPAAHAELGRRYGVKKQSPGRYFANPAPTILYLAMNHDRRLFGGGGNGNVRLKKAVNFAIDRQAVLAQGGAYAGVTNDQYMPPTMRGFRNLAIYPRRT